MKNRTTKLCTSCGETKPVSEFNKNASKSDGLQCHCKVCHSAASARIDEANHCNQTPKVYVLVNTYTAQCYVGSTRRTLKKRYWCHKSAAKQGRKSELYSCMRVFDGDEYWRMETLEELPGASTEELRICEQHWIDNINPALNMVAATKETS